MTYPASTGRNFLELLRVIDSLQLTAKHSVSTPADWKAGDDVIIATAVSDEEATDALSGVRHQEALSAPDTAAEIRSFLSGRGPRGWSVGRIHI